MSVNTVYLFDLDGVLIRPGGYRAAMRATIQDIYRRMGWDNPAPEDTVFDRMEAQGITNEWDMLAFIVALALEQAIERHPGGLPPAPQADHLGWILEQVKTWRLPSFAIDYSPLGQLSRFVGQRSTPAAAFLGAARQGNATFLHYLLACPGLLEELFANIEELSLAPLTRLHQHHVVGSREFTRAYHLPAEIETPSYLELHDQPLLQSRWNEKLLAGWRAGKLGLAAFTARPSLPPRECANGQPGFTAEAEMALRLNGLQEIPLIGYGRLAYLAREMCLTPEHLMKPEPGHALAAILAGLTRQEWPALLAAAGLLREGVLPEGLWLPGFLQVHVFEDAPIGVLAATRAVEILRGQGIQVDLHAWGIAQNPEKERALQAEGARVFPDVNQALENLIPDEI